MDYYMGVCKKIFFGLAVLALAFLLESFWPIAGGHAAAPVVKTAPHAVGGMQSDGKELRGRSRRANGG